jgi:hypothetical protein
MNGARMRLTLLSVALCAIAGVSEFALCRADLQKHRLFVITRNKNDNQVCYDVQVKGGKLDAKTPVIVYWTIPQENNKTEELSSMERSKAYGLDVLRSYGGDSVDIKLKPLPRPLRVKKLDGTWKAVMKIDSTDAVFASAYVMASGGIIPKVQWIRIDGVDVIHGGEVSETIKP